MPVSSNKGRQDTIYILSCDGGGARGYSSAVFADLFFTEWGIDQTKISDYFDIIIGTSTGALIAAGVANSVTPSTIADFYLTEAPWIFSTSSIFPSVQATFFDLAIAILFNSSAYSNATLITKLQEQFGTTKMSDMNTNLLIPSLRADTNNLVIFSSNENLPYTTGHDYFVWEACLASAALPIYLPQVTLSDTFPYLDGGIWGNNPLRTAIDYGRHIKPFASRICILSLGTGRGDIGFDNIPPDPIPPFEGGIAAQIALFDKLLAAPMVAADLGLVIQSSLPFPDIYSYKFQYVVDTELAPNSSDNTTPECFAYQAAVAQSIMESDIVNIQAFINHLNA